MTESAQTNDTAPASPIEEQLAEAMSFEIARQGQDIDNAGDCETILFLGRDPAVNLVELARVAIKNIEKGPSESLETPTPLTLDRKHLKLINEIIVSGGEVDCDDKALDRFHEDRGADPDTINGLIKSGIARQDLIDDDVFCLRLGKPTAAQYPKTLTEELRCLLGLMNFQTGPIAHILRTGGEQIPHKCEDEQAYVLHWMINLYLEHGAEWRDKVTERFQAIAAMTAQAEGTTT